MSNFKKHDRNIREYLLSNGSLSSGLESCLNHEDPSHTADYIPQNQNDVFLSSIPVLSEMNQPPEELQAALSEFEIEDEILEVEHLVETNDLKIKQLNELSSTIQINSDSLTATDVIKLNTGAEQFLPYSSFRRYELSEALEAIDAKKLALAGAGGAALIALIYKLWQWFKGKKGGSTGAKAVSTAQNKVEEILGTDSTSSSSGGTFKIGSLPTVVNMDNIPIKPEYIDKLPSNPQSKALRHITGEITHKQFVAAITANSSGGRAFANMYNTYTTNKSMLDKLSTAIMTVYSEDNAKKFKRAVKVASQLMEEIKSGKTKNVSPRHLAEFKKLIKEAKSASAVVNDILSNVESAGDTIKDGLTSEQLTSFINYFAENISSSGEKAEDSYYKEVTDTMDQLVDDIKQLGKDKGNNQEFLGLSKDLVKELVYLDKTNKKIALVWAGIGQYLVFCKNIVKQHNNKEDDDDDKK